MNVKDILIKAVNCDKMGRLLEAQHHYQDGIEILMKLSSDEKDEKKRKVYRTRIEEYLKRAEQIAENMKQVMCSAVLLQSIAIENDSTGHSYKSLFGQYLNNSIKEILIEEPYLHESYQFRNLIAFFELLLKNCKDITYIRLITKLDSNNQCKQLDILKQISEDLKSRNINLDIKFQNTLHDRKIILNNGYMIKIGRGLHIYKPQNSTYELGYFDHDYRKCLRTDVDIWRTNTIV